MSGGDRHALQALRNAVGAWAATESFVRRIYLVGSRARGNHRPDSDIDLAVLNSIDPVELATCVRSALPLERPTGKQLAALARDWTFKTNRDRWHVALSALFDVPVQLERPRLADRIVRPSLKCCRVLLYRATGPSA